MNEMIKVVGVEAAWFGDAEALTQSYLMKVARMPEPATEVLPEKNGHTVKVRMWSLDRNAVDGKT